MTTSHEGQHDARHPTFKQYVLVAVILFSVTIVEFLLIWDRVGISDDLGASKIPLLVVLSAFKFAIVIMFYMHLKFEARLLSVIFLAGRGLAIIVGIALLGIFFAYEGNPRDFAEALFQQRRWHFRRRHFRRGPVQQRRQEPGGRSRRLR